MKKTNFYAIMAVVCLCAFSPAHLSAQIPINHSDFFDPDGAYFGPTTEETNYSGAYYTGKYESPFKTYLGKTDEEIQAKLDQLGITISVVLLIGLSTTKTAMAQI